MISRRRFLGIAGSALLVAPLVGEAQQPARKTFRIGVLAAGGASDLSLRFDPFRQGLRELGWIEGQNISIQYRYAEGQFDRLRDLAAELTRSKVDIIVTSSTPAAVVAKQSTETIPIVMISVADPVGLRLAASLSHPGGNATGVSYSVGLEIFIKQVELLKETIPKVRRVAVLSNRDHPSHPLIVRDAEAPARSLGIELQILEARAPNEFDRAFGAMGRARAGALLIVGDPMFTLHRTRLAELAARNRLPTASSVREFVEAGALMSYGPRLPDLFRRAAYFVDKILKGAKPGDLPIEQPTKYELVINLKTAKTLGVTVPQSMLLRADEVIQ